MANLEVRIESLEKRTVYGLWINKERCRRLERLGMMTEAGRAACPDLDTRLRNGSKERYDAQYQRFHNLRTGIQPLQALIDLINKIHRCYDQEGYINNNSIVSNFPNTSL